MYDVVSMKSIAEQLNDRTYTDYFYRLMLLSRSIFKWSRLPNGLDEKWIEKFLCLEGKAVFFKDKLKGFMVCKVADGGKLNYYDEPTQVKPYGTDYNGIFLTNYEDCIVIPNNDMYMPTVPTLELFAYRLAEVTRTIDVNINAQKTPIIILCNEKQRLTLKNVYRKYEGNEPVIFGTKDLDISGITVLKTDAPFVSDRLQLQKHAIWNECMTFLGIGNANQDKKERLVSDEVSANNQQIEYSAQIMLKARQNAAQRINEIFKTDIEVSMRSTEELQSILKGINIDTSEANKGGIEQ